MIFTAANHPDSNEIVERANQTLVQKGKAEPFYVSQLKVSKETGKLRRMASALLAVITFFAFLTPITAQLAANITLNAPNTLDSDANDLPAKVNLTYAPPIVWHKTSQVAAIGYNFYRHSAILLSPCTPLHQYVDRLDEEVHEGRRHSMTRVLTDKIACDRMYREKIIATIQANCLEYQLPRLNTSTTAPLLRGKRQVLGLVATGLVSFGVLTVKNYFGEYIRAANINELGLQMHQAIKKIKSQNRLNQAVQKELLVALNHTWKEIDSLRFDLEDESATSARLLSAAMTTISKITNHLELLFDGFKEQKVTSAYARLFPDSPLLGEEPSVYWTAQKCRFQKPDTLMMDFVALPGSHQPALNFLPAIIKTEQANNKPLDFTSVEASSLFWPITAGLIALIFLLIAVACWCYCRTQHYQMWRYNLRNQGFDRQQNIARFDNQPAGTELTPVLATGVTMNTASQTIHLSPDSELAEIEI
ncbi:hypothetical protein TYRP_005504 [Tyrophagus putrescentiae]|nr:hypothetical protein TYRP_005504 [Tyrophagus putrescentiae]